MYDRYFTETKEYLWVHLSKIKSTMQIITLTALLILFSGESESFNETGMFIFVCTILN